MMLNYIRKFPDLRLNISIDNSMEFHDVTIQKYLNNILKSQLTDLSSREKITKRVFDFKAKLPLYIKSDMLLMCIYSLRLVNSFYINYFAINKFIEENDCFIIVFDSGSCIKIYNKGAFKTQIIKAREVIDFLKKQKVFSLL